jgi:hypothetical protein
MPIRRLLGTMELFDHIELANRRNAGVEVRLLWRRDDDECTVAVADERTGESFEVRVTRERALDAFYHPFVYADADVYAHAA